MGDLLTLKEAAKELTFSYSAVYGWVRSGRIRGLRFGNDWRINRVEIDRVLNEGLLPPK